MNSYQTYMADRTAARDELAYHVRILACQRRIERRRRREQIADAVTSCIIIGLFLAFAFASCWLALLASGSN